MTTTIASHNPGRTIHDYDLLDEITDTYKLNRKEAHDGIHAFLSQITSIDGDDDVILDRTPIRPELLLDNPRDLDIYYWLTISDDATEVIRESFAAVYAGE